VLTTLSTALESFTVSMLSVVDVIRVIADGVQMDVIKPLSLFIENYSDVHAKK
jgi:hypothetical protein